MPLTFVGDSSPGQLQRCCSMLLIQISQAGQHCTRPQIFSLVLMAACERNCDSRAAADNNSNICKKSTAPVVRVNKLQAKSQSLMHPVARRFAFSPCHNMHEALRLCLWLCESDNRHSTLSCKCCCAGVNHCQDSSQVAVLTCCNVAQCHCNLATQHVSKHLAFKPTSVIR